ncbi:MAG: PAS domain-containing protein [Ruminococcaceae bacterium]|nr:PAS domain-containing protein [Oscillospiraceae bacterium]
MMMRKLEPDGKTGNYSVLSNIYQNRKYTFAIAIPTATIISGLFLHFNRLQIIPDLTLVVIALLLFIFLLYVLRQNSWFNILNKKLVFDEALYRSIFDQAPIGIAIMQGKTFADLPELVATIINPTYAEILGRDENELRQMTWVEITHTEDL